jgi:hypothetical protein
MLCTRSVSNLTSADVYFDRGQWSAPHFDRTPGATLRT